MCLVLSLQLILWFHVLFSLGKGISFRILPTRAVYNRKEELGEYFSPPSPSTSKLLYYYKILKGFIISIDFNLRVYASKLCALLGQRLYNSQYFLIVYLVVTLS